MTDHHPASTAAANPADAAKAPVADDVRKARRSRPLAVAEAKSAPAAPEVPPAPRRTRPLAVVAEERAPAAAARRSRKSAPAVVEAPAKEPKAKAARPETKRAAIERIAANGVLPTPPDFSAPSHSRYRKKLADLVDLVLAGDIAALRALAIPTYSSSLAAMSRYRDLAVIALEARASAPKEPVAKLAQVKACWEAADKLGALRIASKFFDRSPETLTFKRGWDARSNPDFYRQIGKDPAALVAEAFDTLAAKFELADITA
jgi:hypothetical protein